MTLAFSEIPAIPLQRIDHPVFSTHRLSVSILRLDQLHPQLSGNKWFKLRYNLGAAREANCRSLASFGGAWSNHLHALAWAAREEKIPCVGFVRGEQPEKLSPCLDDCRKWGMELRFLSREAYRQRHDPAFVHALCLDLPQPWVIPEGGANLEGVKGCAEIVATYNQREYDQVMLACGTGATLSGLLMKSEVPVTGIQVLKADGYLQHQVQLMLDHYRIEPVCEWGVRDEFHQGGYARAGKELLAFCDRFESDTGVPVEPVYSGKLLMAVLAMAQAGEFEPGLRLLLIHGGGLQGKRGYI